MTSSPILRRLHRFGDHIDTDVILPGRYLSLTEPEELAPHCFEGLDPGFAARVRPGDLVVAGRNFGAGSSREHAAIAIKACGVHAVIATSFARIFYRNAINIGLPVLVCPGLADEVVDGSEGSIDLQLGRIGYEGRTFDAEPLPATVSAIVAAGGLIPFVRRRLDPVG